MNTSTRIAGLFVGCVACLMAVVSVSKPDKNEAQAVEAVKQPAAAVAPLKLEFEQPAPAVPVKKSQPAQGEFKRRYVDGAYRWVWYSAKAKASQPVRQSGNCANGQCSSPRRGLFGRR